MWWDEVSALTDRVEQMLHVGAPSAASEAVVHPSAEIDQTFGPVIIGHGTRIGAGAVLRGPIIIGSDCSIGNQAFLRGPLLIGNGVSIGFCTELKNASIANDVCIGPMCFVADSRVDQGAYLGAMVRTSNQRLDRGRILALAEGQLRDTGMTKLGCWIQQGASLGIQVIILPGRIVAAGSIIEPRITITRNLPPGHYRINQSIELVEQDHRP